MAHVILRNQDKIATLVKADVREIPYKALGEHVVETTEVDITRYKPGQQILLKDFDICGNENVEVLMDTSAVVATVTKTAKA